MKTTIQSGEQDMTSLRNTSRNEEKAARAVIVLEEAMTEVLRRGFFGTVNLELAVQDGTIQHLRKRVEELER